MQTIEFKIDPERFTLGDLIALEEAQNMKYRDLRDLMAHEMVDENGEYMEFDQACEVLKSINFSQFMEVGGRLKAAIEELKKSMVPPKQGGEL